MKLYNPKLELKVLKSICQSKELGAYLLASVSDDYFNNEANQKVYKKIKHTLRDKGYIMEWDEVLSDPSIEESTRDILAEQNDIKIIKDKDKAKHIISKLEDLRKARALTLMADNILNTVKAEKFDIDNLMETSADLLNKSKFSSMLDDCFIHIGDKNNSDDIVKGILQGKAFEYVPTGFQAFDDLNRGLPTKSLITIAGPTGAGKSLFSQQLAMNMALWGAKTCYVPLEMGGEELVQRMLANISDNGLEKFVNADKQLVGNVAEQKEIYAKYKDFRNKLINRGNTLSIFNPPQDMTMEEILFLLKPHNYKVIIIDYIGLLAGVDGDDQWQKLGAAARFAKIYADNTNSIVVCCAQLSDEGKIRYSHAIAEHCVTGETYVNINGSITQVAELVAKYNPTKDGIEIPCEIETSTGMRKIEKFYSFGKKKIRRIYLEDGNTVATTMNTPVLVLDTQDYYLKWVKTEDIMPSRHYLIQKNSDRNFVDSPVKFDYFYDLPTGNSNSTWKNAPVKYPTEMTESLAKLLGYLAGDGCIKPDSDCLEFTNQNINILEDYKKCLYDCFGVNVDYKFNKTANTYIIVYHNKCAYKFIESLNAVGDSYTKDLPRCVLKSGKTYWLYYIEALLQCDGTKGNGNNNFGLCLNSKNLISKVSMLLRFLGCRVKTTNTKDKMYSLYVSNDFMPNSVIEMMDRLKQLNPDKWNKHNSSSSACNSMGSIPNFINYLKKFKHNTKNCVYDELGNQLPYQIPFIKDFGGTRNLKLKDLDLNSSLMETLKKYFYNLYNMIYLLKTNDLIPVKIKSTSYTENNVYDFTVKEDNQGNLLDEGHFIANSIVIHNSTAMFTWTMDETAKQTGIIKIVLQKARNMRPDPFNLKFNYNKMRVEDVTEDDVAKAEQTVKETTQKTKTKSKKKDVLDPALLDDV